MMPAIFLQNPKLSSSREMLKTRLAKWCLMRAAEAGPNQVRQGREGPGQTTHRALL